jgi:hypothetical protein
MNAIGRSRRVAKFVSPTPDIMKLARLLFDPDDAEVAGWSNFRPPLNLRRPSLTRGALAGTPAPSRNDDETHCGRSQHAIAELWF